MDVAPADYVSCFKTVRKTASRQNCVVRIVPTETWGAPSCRLFAFEVKD